MAEELYCPVCGEDSNSYGEAFRSLRAVSLHIAGKASFRDHEHRQWILELLPSADISFGNTNRIGAEIEFYVQGAIRLAQEEPVHNTAADTAAPLPGELSPPERAPGERTREELERYVLAYERIWDIEARLHRFAEMCLSERHGITWWSDAAPSGLLKEILEVRDSDGRRATPENYMNLIQLGEFIKGNKDTFNPAFESMKSHYKEPHAVFFDKLKKTNQIRNDVMHPLKRLTPSDDNMGLLEKFAGFVKAFTAFG